MAASTRIALVPTTPWALRIFDRIPLPPFWVGIVVGLAVFCVFLVYTAAFQDEFAVLSGLRRPSWAAELHQDLFIGLTLAVSVASVRGARRDYHDLLPHLELRGTDRETLDRQIVSYQRAPLLAFGLLVGSIAAFPSALDPVFWDDAGFPGWSHPSVLWMFGRNFVNWWFVSRAMVLELMLGRAFSKLGDHLGPIDLLDRAPLAPFGRRALRNVLLWMLLAAFLSLSYLQEGWASDLMALALAGLLGFALTAFLLPLLGAHRRIRELKQRELDVVRGALRETREQTLAPNAAAAGMPGGRLADLVSYEARVMAVGEWPIDATTLVRLGLYLAIGLGSWVGAALVERVLDTTLR